MVAAHHALRVRPARVRVEREVVDHVAAEGRQLDAVSGLGGRGAGLGELACDTADLHRRNAGAVRQHDGHLEDHLELVANRVGGEGVERLRAVARLQQERVAGGHGRQRLRELSSLASEHERRLTPKLSPRRVERGGVGPFELLAGRTCAPAVRRPRGAEHPRWVGRRQWFVHQR